MLSRPDARLMIIGYGFRDSHINEMLLQGARKGAKLFIIDPCGVDALKLAPPITGDARQLYQQLQGNIIGASRRLFLSNFTSDHIELGKLLRFFSTSVARPPPSSSTSAKESLRSLPQVPDTGRPKASLDDRFHETNHM